MKRALLALFLSASAASHAAPIGFKDSWMLMADLAPSWRESSVNYAFTARDALGASGAWLRSDDKRVTREAVEVTYTRLAKRWNLPHAQANLWLFANAGTIRGNDFAGSRTLLSPGVQADYETTRVYLAATAKLLRAKDLNHDLASVRAGFSFHEADYDETQPWFVVEARRMRGLSGRTEVTPMLRLIHNRWFVEAGYSNMKQARFNLMYTY